MKKFNNPFSHATKDQQITSYKKKLEEYSLFKETMLVILKKMQKHYEPINSNLS